MCCEFAMSAEVFRDAYSSVLTEPLKWNINIAHNEIYVTATRYFQRPVCNKSCVILYRMVCLTGAKILRTCLEIVHLKRKIIILFTEALQFLSGKNLPMLYSLWKEDVTGFMNYVPGDSNSALTHMLIHFLLSSETLISWFRSFWFWILELVNVRYDRGSRGLMVENQTHNRKVASLVSVWPGLIEHIF